MRLHGVIHVTFKVMSGSTSTYHRCVGHAMANPDGITHCPIHSIVALPPCGSASRPQGQFFARENAVTTGWEPVNFLSCGFICAAFRWTSDCSSVVYNFGTYYQSILSNVELMEIVSFQTHDSQSWVMTNWDCLYRKVSWTCKSPYTTAHCHIRRA